ncbi:hypothetical protein [Methanobacterium oryzae]|uniref:hypothetical protein n=1 Tax=Methanobacterium oryzae TaxID=69540 RepID=UPI003D254054
MTPLETFAILVLAGAVIVLLYYFIREMNSTGSVGFDTLRSSASNMGKGVSNMGTHVSEGVSQPNFDSVKSGVSNIGKGVSDMGGRVSEGISQKYNGLNVGGEGKMSGVSERVSGMGDKLKGKVKEVPISTDVFSGRIDEFLHEQSDQLIKDWELATKSDIGLLEKKYNKVTRDIDDLERRFNEYRGHANKKFENIENRLTALEGEEKI